MCAKPRVVRHPDALPPPIVLVIRLALAQALIDALTRTFGVVALPQTHMCTEGALGQQDVVPDLGLGVVASALDDNPFCVTSGIGPSDAAFTAHATKEHSIFPVVDIV